jgi:amidase/aspartyl-tRNA(Asn)/glutamyl-tRNA(Gln) amidotransferase subunit A
MTQDPFALGERADPLPAVRRPIGGWRIAYRPDFGVFPVEPEAAAAVANAVRVLGQAGAAVPQVSLPHRP